MDLVDAIGAILALLICVACVYYTGRIARRRGRSVRAWIWIGAFFGIFGLIAVWLLPDRSPQIPREPQLDG